MFIPDPDFLPIQDPGSRGQKGTYPGSGSATLADPIQKDRSFNLSFFPDDLVWNFLLWKGLQELQAGAALRPPIRRHGADKPVPAQHTTPLLHLWLRPPRHHRSLWRAGLHCLADQLERGEPGGREGGYDPLSRLQPQGEFVILLSSVSDPGCLSRIRIFPSRNQGQKDSGSGSHLILSKLSEIWSGMFIPDPDFDFLPIPEGSKRHRIPDPQPCFSKKKFLFFKNLFLALLPYGSEYVKQCTGTVRHIITQIISVRNSECRIWIWRGTLYLKSDAVQDFGPKWAVGIVNVEDRFV